MNRANKNILNLDFGKYWNQPIDRIPKSAINIKNLDFKLGLDPKYSNAYIRISYK
jgi:hypothetical protein